MQRLELPSSLQHLVQQDRETLLRQEQLVPPPPLIQEERKSQEMDMHTHSSKKFPGNDEVEDDDDDDDNYDNSDDFDSHGKRINYNRDNVDKEATKLKRFKEEQRRVWNDMEELQLLSTSEHMSKV
jgi:hypothetical protein